MNYSLDYEELFNNIANKFKKHPKYKLIFKKPNFIEASESLNSLIKLMNEEECPEYAGVFYLTKARCDTASKEIHDEANDLIMAAENFVKAEDKLKQMNITSVQDFLECGVMCYIHAVMIFVETEKFHLALSNGLRLIQILKDYDKYNDAINIYNLLMPVLKLNLEMKVKLLLDRGYCQIKTRNFHLAIIDYKEALDRLFAKFGSTCNIIGRFRDFLVEAEIYRVLLLLKLDNATKNQKLLEEYSLDKINFKSISSRPVLMQKDEQLFYHLLGFIHSICVTEDHATAEDAAIDLQRHLTDVQNELVCEIIEQLINPNGDAF